MLHGVEIEHEVCQRSLELCAEVPIDGKARAGKLCSARQIEHAELFAEFPMWFWRKAKLRGSSPTSDLDIVMLAASDRDTGMRQVGNLRHNTAQLFFQLRSYFLL